MKAVSLIVQHELSASIYCLPSMQFQLQLLKRLEGSSPCPPGCALRETNGGRSQTDAHANGFQRKASCKGSLDENSCASLCMIQSTRDIPGIRTGWR